MPKHSDKKKKVAFSKIRQSQKKKKAAKNKVRAKLTSVSNRKGYRTNKKKN